MSFDPESKFLTCCSNRSTIHIFKVEKGANVGFKYISPFVGKVMSYANDQWSFAKLYLPESDVKNGGTKASIANGVLHVYTT